MSPSIMADVYLSVVPTVPRTNLKVTEGKNLWTEVSMLFAYV